MANSETVLIRGKLKWVKHIRPDTTFEPHKWTVTVYPDEDGLEKIKGLKKQGLQNHLKMDDDGQYMQFGRKTEKDVKGRKEGMTPPKVVDKDGIPIEVMIGNGSDGVVELEVYSHKTQQAGVTKKAARWRGLTVDNLVPYKVDDGADAEEVKAMLNRAEPLF